eukprot:COSAG05_NODE_11124_length_529_cov_1.283721_1_plen_137_part_10
MRKERMAELAGGKSVDIAQVWHGTRATEPDVIYRDRKDGFMMQHARAGMWGPGCYFAENASYSSNYAHDYALTPAHDRTIGKCMFLASLIVGEAIDLQPNQQLKCPPNQPSGERYDTVTGTTGGSKVYVVYENGRAY